MGADGSMHRYALHAGGHLNIARIMRCARSAHEQLAAGPLRINLSALCLCARLLRGTASNNATKINVCTTEPGAPRALVTNNPPCTRRDGREDQVPLGPHWATTLSRQLSCIAEDSILAGALDGLDHCRHISIRRTATAHHVEEQEPGFGDDAVHLAVGPDAVGFALP